MANEQFDPEQSEYDYETALRSGLSPDLSGHWPSRDPKTGLILKGRKHPTFDKTIEAEKALGYTIIKKGTRYYSVPPESNKISLMANGSNIPVPLSLGGSVQAPNMFQRLGAILQGQPDPQQAFNLQDFQQKMQALQLMQQQQQLNIQSQREKREEAKFTQQAEGLREFQEAASLLATQPEQAIQKMAIGAFKAGDKDAFLRAFDLADKFKKNEEVKAAFKIYRDRLTEGIAASQREQRSFTGAEAHQILLDVVSDTGATALGDALKDITSKAYPGEFEALKDELDLLIKKKTLEKGPSVGVDREAISDELFQMPFNKLTAGQKTEVNERVRREKLSLAAEQGRAIAMDKSLFELSAQRANVRRVIDGINSVQDKIKADPAILGVVGNLSRAITSAADQAKAFASLIIPGVDYEALNKIDKYANIFRSSGITSTQLQSQLLGLAIAVSTAEGFTGREVTDRKIQINLRRLAGAVGGGSAEAAFDTLEQFKNEMARGYQTNIEGIFDREQLRAPLLKPEDKRTFGASVVPSPTRPPSLTKPPPPPPIPGLTVKPAR